jgi:hypothetical protein
LVIAAALAAGVLPPAGTAAPAPAVTGTVSGVDGSTLTVSSGGATVRVTLTADTRIIRRDRVTLTTIKPNDFVGVTAKREADGGLTAIAINIFPPEFRGSVRQAQFPMESGNIMTNAIVFQNVRRIDGRTLYLKLPDGTAVITVPPSAEIFKLTVIRAADLQPGMRVTVRGTSSADGGLTATTITAEAAR